MFGKHCAWYLCQHMHQYLRCTRGVAAMEYAIIVGVVVVAVGAGAALFQDDIASFLGNVGTDLTDTRQTVEDSH